MGEGEQATTIATLNRAMNQYNLLQVRLDTSDVINQIKMYLKSEIEILTQDKEMNYERKVIKLGKPKANEEGIGSILNWIQSSINSQVVQGNFPMDIKGSSTMFDKYIYEFQVNFGLHILNNLPKYDIDDSEVEGIIDCAMNTVIPFMTRLIGNKERESYGETFREVNTNTLRGVGKEFKITK